MTRATIVSAATLTLALAFAAGCDKGADEQQKANTAQAEADKKIAQAQAESTTKVTGAQLEADQTIAGAEAAFVKRREDYRHTLRTALVDVDKKVQLFEAKAKAATGKTKTDLDAKLADIRARRAAFDADMTSIETTTAPRWDDAKVRVDKALYDLQTFVDKATY
jgi:hypothetical protein